MSFDCFYSIVTKLVVLH